jgi:hypothetical protein
MLSYLLRIKALLMGTNPMLRNCYINEKVHILHKYLIASIL